MENKAKEQKKQGKQKRQKKQKKQRKQKRQKKQYGKGIKNNLFLIKLSFQTSPFYICDMLFESLKQQGLNFLEHTIGIYVLLSAVEEHKDYSYVATYIGIIIACWMVSFYLSSLFNNLVGIKGEARVLMKLRNLLYEKAKDMDLSCYDDPEYYDEFVLSISEAENVMKRTHELLRVLVDGLVNLLTAGIFFLAVDGVAALFIVTSVFLNMFFSSRLNKVNFKRKLKVNPLERKREYIHRVSYLNEYAKELKLNKGIIPMLEEDFEKVNDEIYAVDETLCKKRFGLQFLRSYVSNTLIMDVLFITYLVYQAAVLHRISYSSVVVLFKASRQLRRGFRRLSEVLPTALENSMYIQKMRDFLSYENKMQDGELEEVPGEPKAVRLENVSFAYREGGEPVLRDINLTISPGEKIALVGYNGAGKTTLVKLLMRLYDPTEGKITLDGRDIREYKIKKYRERIATVFQDFKIFAATVAENVVMREPVSEDEPAIRKALKNSGFEKRLESLKDGLETPMTTEFEENGVNLSGGENQKLAISRVFYKDASLIILDEPSSALDPISEYQLNHTMLAAAEHRSVVFISHRLSTTRKADRIVMLEKGQIIEQGTHEELLDMEGKYARMWKAQAECYID